MCEEIWKDVVGLEGYYKVSNIGRVKNSRGKILKPLLNSKGYLRMQLRKDGKNNLDFIHRIVARAFISTEIDQIDHIDGNKKNNMVSNLRICTVRQNVNYYFKNEYAGSYKYRSGRWGSRIFKEGKSVHLGTFNTQKEAADAYKQALAILENTKGGGR